MNNGPSTARPDTHLRVATRRSALAMAQARTIGVQLAALTGRELELVEVTTRGDVDLAPLDQIGGTGVFVAAVRQAVVDGRADLAVHSLKDLPTTPDPRLRLAAVPPREDPRDVLVARPGATLLSLPAGARVGTGSPRRRCQVAAARPDLELVAIRGNVDTRLARVGGSGRAAPGTGSAAGPASDTTGTERGGDLDAVILAAAGLSRLGRTDQIAELIDPGHLMPAPGQGALAVEVLADPGDSDHLGAAAPSDAVLSAALRTLDDPDTRAAVTAERALLAALEAGCSAPIGALAQRPDATSPDLQLRAVLARPDGSLVRMASTGSVDQAERLGRRLAGRLTTAGPNAAQHSSITAHRGSSQ